MPEASVSAASASAIKCRGHFRYLLLHMLRQHPAGAGCGACRCGRNFAERPTWFGPKVFTVIAKHRENGARGQSRSTIGHQPFNYIGCSSVDDEDAGQPTSGGYSPTANAWMSWCEWLWSHMFPLKASAKCFEFDVSLVRFLMGVLLRPCHALVEGNTVDPSTGPQVLQLSCLP